MMSSTRWLWLAMSAFAAGPIFAKDPAPCTGASPESEMGAVSLSVGTNGNLPYAYEDIGIVQVLGGKPGRTCTLKAVTADASVSTTYFAMRLPAGDYRFFRFGTYSIPRDFAASAAEVVGGDKLGTFRIVAGRRSDLGRIVVHAPRSKQSLNPDKILFELGRSSLAVTNADRRPFGAAQALLDLPESAQPWLQPRAGADAVETYAVAHPIGFGSPSQISPDVLAFPAGIGGIWLKRGSAWNRISTDTGHVVVDVMPARDAGAPAVAVGELGLLASIDSTGKMAPIDPGDLPFGRNIFLEGNAKTGWYLVQSVGLDIAIYHSMQLAAGRWTRVASERGSWKAMDDYQSFWIWRDASGFTYAVSGGQIHSLDLASGQWTVRSAPGQIVDISSGSGGLAVRVFGKANAAGSATASLVAGVRGKTFTSTDRGIAWVPWRTPRKLLQRAPLLGPAGLQLQLQSALTKASAELLLSSDSGASWSEVPGALHKSVRALEAPNGSLFLVGQYEILSSEDQGRTWRVEHRD